MRGAGQHRNQEIPTINIINCPSCNKKRLRKYINDDGSVDAASTETVEVRGDTRFLEVCQFCVEKYQRADERFVIENMKKLRKAFNDKDNAGTDHNDFSLNVD